MEHQVHVGGQQKQKYVPYRYQTAGSRQLKTVTWILGKQGGNLGIQVQIIYINCSTVIPEVCKGLEDNEGNTGSIELNKYTV